MNSDLFYNITYVCIDTFSIYTLYRIMRIFFHGSPATFGRHIEFCSYVFHFAVNIILYYTLPIPIVLMTTSVATMLLIAANYEGSVAKKVFSVLFITFLSACIEIIVAFLTSYEDVSSMFVETKYFPMTANFAVKVLTYFAMLLIGRLYRMKSKVFMPRIYWLLLIPLPLSAMFIIVTITNTSPQHSMQQGLLGICIIFMTNLIMIFFYDILAMQVNEKAKRLERDKEMAGFDQQFEIIQSNLNYWNRMQNHFRENIVLLGQYLGEDISPEAKDFIDGNFANFFIRDNVCSGVAVIDGMMNYKIREMDSLQIKVNPSIAIPRELIFSNVDAFVILNSMFAYAAELVLPLEPDRRKIEVGIRFYYNMHRLVFKFVMPYISSQNSRFDPPDIFGELVEKYMGTWNVKEDRDCYDREVRSLRLMLFLNKKNFP